MAFVRWRGNSASLLATVYDQGRSRQVLLARLGTGYEVPSSLRRQVAQRFPTIVVDWVAVNTAMAQGPVGSPPLTFEAMSFLTVENSLREWTQVPCPYRQESHVLLEAATVLARWRARQSNMKSPDLGGDPKPERTT